MRSNEAYIDSSDSKLYHHHKSVLITAYIKDVVLIAYIVDRQEVLESKVMTFRLGYSFIFLITYCYLYIMSVLYGKSTDYLGLF